MTKDKTNGLRTDKQHDAAGETISPGGAMQTPAQGPAEPHNTGPDPQEERPSSSADAAAPEHAADPRPLTRYDTKAGPVKPSPAARLLDPGAVSPGFKRLLLAAEMVPERDHGRVRSLLVEARRLRLSEAEIAILCEVMGEAADLTAKVMAKLAAEAANFDDTHGVVGTVDQLSQAFEAALLASNSDLVAAEGCLWLYAAPALTPPDEEAGYWRPMPLDAAERMMLRQFAGLSAAQKASDRREAYQRVCARRHADDDFFAHTAAGLPLQNGFLRLTDDGNVDLVPHAPEQRARFKLAVSYDPEARAEEFLAGLERLMGGDEDKVEAFLQFAAAVLFGFRPRRDTVRSVLLLYGPPRSGKSTAAELLKRFVPEYARSALEPSQWSDGKLLAKLRGVTLNVVPELAGQTRAIQGATFKTVASWEPTTVREPYMAAATLLPRARHLFCCNQLPSLSERDPSIARRLLVLQVGSSLDEAELRPDFLEEAWAEAPGIVNLLAAQAELLWSSGRFTQPADSAFLVLRMQYRDDPAQIVARLWVEAAQGARATTVELQKAMRVMARRLGLHRFNAGAAMKTLVPALADLYGAERHRSNGRPFYAGVRLRSEAVEAIAQEHEEDEFDDL